MADFLLADKRTESFEGAYSNDTGDAGGETIWGIARNEDPEWDGWALVDEYRKRDNFPANLNCENIMELVHSFYQKKYWNPMRGNEITSQDEANSIYDSCVNMGIEEGIKIAQRSAGVEETGVMDDRTLNALNN